MATQYHLLKTRRFCPLFVTQFLNAFNDNVLKNALIILITYKIAKSESYEQMMIAITGGIFILPFFLFSSAAGQVADKFEKSLLIKIIKFFEIIFMTTASIGFYLNNLTLLIITLFMSGVHSTFFGPLKYSILPDHLKKDELIGGNALIEAGTFIAILVGSILGGILIMSQYGVHLISIALLCIAITGWLSSLFIPRAKAGQPELVIDFNIFKSTWQIIDATRQKRDVFLAILGISWFWLVGATFITQFPSFTKDILSSSSYIVTLFFTIFSLGIATGSLLCNKLLKGEISAKYAPLSILGMSLFIFDIFFATHTLTHTHSSSLLSFKEFFYSINRIRVVVDVFLMSVCGGIFVVPLYALIQARSDEKSRSRIIACNNILNALFMVFSALLIMVVATHLTIPQLFLLIGILNIFVAIFICKLLPDAVIHSFLKWLLQLCYRVEVKGMSHYSQAGKRIVIIANHTSFLDAALLAAFLPDKLTFAVNTLIARKWWMRPISKIINTFPIDPTNPLAIKSLIKMIRGNRRCVIFPEGRITVTGSLMKIYEGPGMIADQADASLLPIRIEGAQYTPFSKLRKKIKIHWFPKITLTILPSYQLNIAKEIKGRPRRWLIGQKLYDVMSNMIFESAHYQKTLFTSLLEAHKLHTGKHIILEDIQRRPLNYSELLHACFILGTHLKIKLHNPKFVGLLLPNSIGNVVCFFALHCIHSIPAMLNYTLGIKNLLLTCQLCAIQKVITSRQFISAGNLENSIEALKEAGIDIFYLEDLKTEISYLTKIKGYIKSIFPNYFYKKYNVVATDPAVILFTSGSEGIPKGVAISHENIQANRSQLSARIDFSAEDIVFNALPMFHSFGLSSATLLPILSGIKTFLYPSPLHYRIIPELIYDIDATITFGTDTFLRGYGRYADPYDFYSIRYVLAGAEKLKDETQEIWTKKFGIRILEGYGATETSPVISMNTPMHYKPHTVGRLLPGISYRLKFVPGVKMGGRLYLRGPNIMLGYLAENLPGKIVAPEDGWYDTGDIVSMDEEGFITLQGRAKRFAKIGGEMVSLTAIETCINELWTAYLNATIVVTDSNKGEQITLVTTHPSPDRDELMQYIKMKGLSEIHIPKRIINIKKMPLLGTGKIDYVALQTYIRDHKSDVAPEKARGSTDSQHLP